MASSEAVEQAIRTLMQKISGASPDPAAVPDRTILCVVPDLQTAFSAHTKGARLDGLTQVPSDSPADVRLTARSDDLIAMIDGRLNVGFAFLTGKVRVDAAPSDLMLLRKLF